MNAKTALVLIALTFNVCALRADHPPEWLVAKVRPEHSLGGIVVGETSVRSAVKLFGRPTSNGPLTAFPGESEYVWVLDNSEIRATTMHPLSTASEDQVIYAVHVKQKSGRRSKVVTGAGVSFDVRLESLIAVYGARYLTHWRKLSEESGTVTFIFRDNTELSFGFSDEGRVIAISLIGSLE